MKSLIKILAICYVVLITPFVLRILYGLWMFKKFYVEWGLGAIVFMSFFFGLIVAFITFNDEIGTWDD